MAGPAHRSAFRDALGAGLRTLLHCGAAVGRGRGPGQALGAVRAVEARSEERLLRNELDADEFAMASLVDAVHWLRAGRSTGVARPGHASPVGDPPFAGR
jgi:hypothetical protein